MARLSTATTWAVPVCSARATCSGGGWPGGAGTVGGPALNHWPITGLRITIEPGAAFTQRLPAHDRAFLYVLSGRVRAAGRTLNAGDVAWSDPVAAAHASPQQSSTLELRVPAGDEVATLILFAGQPIGDPVSVGGPFVMNTRAEISQAFNDFDSGKFGQVPRQARRSVLGPSGSRRQSRAPALPGRRISDPF